MRESFAHLFRRRQTVPPPRLPTDDEVRALLDLPPDAPIVSGASYARSHVRQVPRAYDWQRQGDR